jgi:23S rRNA pseudouridine1911/1915/1917 synthase
VQFVVGETEAGQRLDVALASLAGISRSQSRRWVDEGRVRLDGRPGRPSQRVEHGSAIDATPPEPLPSPLRPEALPLRVLHEDADLIVVDKDAGMVVHPAPGHTSGTLVNALLHHCGDLAGVGGVLRPGIVHRLDRGTSGVLVAAKCDDAHRDLARQFHEHSVERVYLALVRGVPKTDEGRIEGRIGRHPHDRKRMSLQAHAGREAGTAWRVLRRFAAAERSWLELRPETGRTHQIRVHLSSHGLPLVGDPIYGRERGVKPALARPALHAAVLGFTHPRTAARLRFEAPLPPDLEELLARLEAREALP